jgi:hypothetical protein
MADRGHADADQVGGRQLRQHFAIDIVVAECRRVLFEPQPAQPRHYVHAVILRTKERQAYCSKRIYRLRHKIENFFCHIKDWRRLATRYDRLARNFLAANNLVAALFWIRLCVKPPEQQRYFKVCLRTLLRVADQFSRLNGCGSMPAPSNHRNRHSDHIPRQHNRRQPRLVPALCARGPDR